MASDATPPEADRPVDQSVPPRLPDPAGPAERSGPADSPGSALWPALAVYTALRILLVAVLAALLSLLMPLIVALLFAIVLQLPLAWVLFGRQRRRVNAALERVAGRRRAERDALRQALRGD